MRALTVAAVCAISTVAASAATIYETNTGISFVNNVNTGTRSVSGGGLIAGGNYANDSDNESVSWRVVDNGNGTWTYNYVLSGFSSPGISHIIIDITDNCTSVAACVSGANVTPELGAYSSASQGTSNPGLTGEIVGLKFNTNGAEITFTSNRAPVWGDFYVKGGSDSFVRNTGNTNHASDNPNYFIVRPDGVIPEPGSMALVGLGLLGAGLLRRNK